MPSTTHPNQKPRLTQHDLELQRQLHRQQQEKLAINHDKIVEILGRKFEVKQPKKVEVPEFLKEILNVKN